MKIIAEVGSNWNGDIALAKKLIKSSKNAGCDFVKFQYWKAEDLFEKSDKNWKYMKKSEFSFKTAEILKKYFDKIGIGCFWSVFSPESVQLLEKLDVEYYKIASLDNNLPYFIFVLDTPRSSPHPISPNVLFVILANLIIFTFIGIFVGFFQKNKNDLW